MNIGKVYGASFYTGLMVYVWFVVMCQIYDIKDEHIAGGYYMVMIFIMLYFLIVSKAVEMIVKAKANE